MNNIDCGMTVMHQFHGAVMHGVWLCMLHYMRPPAMYFIVWIIVAVTHYVCVELKF